MTDFDAEWEAIKNDRNRRIHMCYYISFDVCLDIDDAVEAYLCLGTSARFAVLSRVMDIVRPDDVVDAIIGLTDEARGYRTEIYLITKALTICKERLEKGPLDEVGLMAGDEVLGAAILKMTSEGYLPADDSVQIYGRAREMSDDVRKDEETS